MKTKPTKPEPPKAIEAKAESIRYVLRLYVAGQTQKSAYAILNIKKISEEYLNGRYTLEVIDLYQQPQLAQGEQIIALPTLIRKLPPPCDASSGICRTPNVCWLDWTYKGKHNAKRIHNQKATLA